MSELQEVQERIAARRVARRRFLTQAGVGVAGLGLAAASAGGASAQFATASNTKKTTFDNGNDRFRVKDEGILNFSLNLEYLEAEFYLRAVLGRSLDDNDITGVSGFRNQGPQPQVDPGPVSGGRQVTFTNPVIGGLARELASDEENHVRFFRAALGSRAVARPAINLDTSFDLAARAAGLGNSFDPYASEGNFLLGSFIFEDVGVTAFKGASPFIKDPDILEAAAGVLAVEAYHSGAIRTLLTQAALTGLRGVTNTPNTFYSDAVQKISNLRDGADGPDDKDQGILNDPNAATTINIVPTDANSIVYSRTFAEVLGIVYLGGAPGVGGGFFPNGLNGRIR